MKLSRVTAFLSARCVVVLLAIVSLVVVNGSPAPSQTTPFEVVIGPFSLAGEGYWSDGMEQVPSHVAATARCDGRTITVKFTNVYPDWTDTFKWDIEAFGTPAEDAYSPITLRPNESAIRSETFTGSCLHTRFVIFQHIVSQDLTRGYYFRR